MEPDRRQQNVANGIFKPSRNVLVVADVLLQQASDEDTVSGTKGESEETSSGSEIETTKKRKNKEQDRCER